MTGDHAEPPITLPSAEERWFWTRQAVISTRDHARLLADVRDHALPRVGKTLDRLQHDLAAHIAEDEREFRGLQDSIEMLAKEVEDFVTEHKETVVKPLAELQTWRHQLIGGWRVSLFAASALGSIFGGVIVGLILYKVTGKP